MTKDHYEWVLATDRTLALYVQPDDLPKEFQLPKYINRLDLLQAEGTPGIAAQLYILISKQRLQYDLAPFNPRAGVTQIIRKPAAILNEKRGTCLDLAVLFATMCLANDLLPLLIVVEGHAFVGFSLTRTRHDEKKAPKALAWEKGKLTDLCLLKELEGQEYLFVECTGAAQSQTLSPAFPEGGGRDGNGRMTFERAWEAGREQLIRHLRSADGMGTSNQRTFLYALDIHDLQVHHGFEPIQGDHEIVRRDTQNYEEQERVLEAAIAKQVPVQKPTELMVLIRQKGSGGLQAILEIDRSHIPTKEDVTSKPFRLEFPLDARGKSGDLILRIVSPDFEPKSQERKVLIYPDRDSEIYTFLLTPQHKGELLLSLELYKDDFYVAAGILRTNGEASDRELLVSHKALVSIPLIVFSYTNIFSGSFQGPVQVGNNDVANTGSGAVATGGSVAVGEGGVAVKGNAEGNIIVTGDKTVGNNIAITGGTQGAILNIGVMYQIYQPPLGQSRLNHDDFERLLRNYLTWIKNAYGKVRLYGLENLEAAHERPRRELTEMFVPLSLQRLTPPRRRQVEEAARAFTDKLFAEQRAYLELVERQRHGAREIAMRDLLTLGPRLAVIGGAGCGKSTLLAFLAAALAERELNKASLPFDLPPERRALIPLVIPLRYWREYLPPSPKEPYHNVDRIHTATLRRFILWYLKEHSQAFKVADAELVEDFFDGLLTGGGCLLMLDGLDEVVSREERSQIKEALQKLADAIYRDNIFLVTAREAGYRGDAVFSDDFVRLDVRPLNTRQIERLVRNWCAQIYPEQVGAQTEEITRAIQDINGRYERQHLPPLISTPLMTTMVVSVKWGEAELPRERSRLYEATVKVLLQAQYLDDDEIRQELVNQGGRWEDQREWLAHLALEMQRGGQASAAIPEVKLREILSAHFSKAPKKLLEQFIRVVRERGGLLEEKAELFQFVHLTFQEFLAARLLAKDRQKSLQGLKEHIADPRWREVLLLLYGFAKSDYPPFAEKYLQWLSKRAGPLRLAGLELAGAAVLEIERLDPALRQQQAVALVKALTTKTLASRAIWRARAGDTLSRLDDPRFQSDVWYLPAPAKPNESLKFNEPLLGFVEVPAGPFIMGGDNQKDPQATEDELPQHEITLPTYYIGRYPVTVAQFRTFVNESHYVADKESVEGLDNHPVVNVTRQDALVYCQWLMKRLCEWSETPEPLAKLLRKQGWVITLPSEAEWEKAARGTQGRIFPWDNELVSECANYRDSGIGKTSAVGCFPAGASPYGCLDMAGNVWEWTRSKFESYPYKPEDGREVMDDDNATYVLRGGSFLSGSSFSRCSFRYWRHSLENCSHLGFRLVVSRLAANRQGG